jgi:hypothetical protein
MTDSTKPAGTAPTLNSSHQLVAVDEGRTVSQGEQLARCAHWTEPLYAATITLVGCLP